MKAAVIRSYGLKDVIKIEEMPKPEIQEDQVLIKVYYSSINYADHAMLVGHPFVIRVESGLFKPKKAVIGMDVAGLIEAVGNNVKDYKIGDRVFLDNSFDKGGYGGYVAVNADSVSRVPKGVSLKDAGVMPLAGVTALQGLRDIGQLKEGQKLLVVGATGGVGSMAVSIGKAMNAHVTAVASSQKLSRVEALNPDFIVNSSKLDVCESEEKYDLIYDCAAYRPASDYSKILSKKGTYICNGGSMKYLFKVILFGKFMSKKGGQTFTNYLAKASKSDLDQLAAWMSEGKIKPLIDSVYPLDRLEEAFLHYKSRKTCGKIAIVLEEEVKDADSL